MIDQPPDPHGKLLLFSDVHGMIPQMNDFLGWLINERKENIAFAVHLGDFWSGRNFNGKEQIFTEWSDRTYFDKFPLPIFFLRGNEDLPIPEEFWISEKTYLMKDQEPFYLDEFKVFPIDYHFRGEKSDIQPKHPEISENDHFDFILSHRPPLGLLDHTLHLETHKRLTNTGSPMVRHYVDMLKPAITFFGHFHYSNYLQYESGLVVCIDKLIRVGKGDNNYRYSYALVDPVEKMLEVFWKSRLFFKYSLLEQKIKIVNQFDHRNVYVRKHKGEE
jgi:Icc-related predicted phosphoesterase